MQSSFRRRYRIHSDFIGIKYIMNYSMNYNILKEFFQVVLGMCLYFNRNGARSVLTALPPVTNQSDIKTISEIEMASPVPDINAEMLIAIPDRIPSPYLVPPPFPPPFSVLIKRRHSSKTAARRYYEEPVQFSYVPNQGKRLPVNSIQDILNQMEHDSSLLDRYGYKKPKRINFYGRYKHRPNRPKVIPIQYGSDVLSPPPPPIRDSNPSVVNHLITPNTVPQRDPSQSFYPIPNIPHTTSQSNGLYEQIIATNKQRQETAKDARPFSLMLDIYPMSEDNTTKHTTTLPPPLSPPQLPPLQIDHSYYNTMKFPQIHPTYSPDQYSSFAGPESSNEQPGKMVVHLNLYPTKKQISKQNEPTNKISFFGAQDDDSFVPIVNPQVFYRSRASEDYDTSEHVRTVQPKGSVIEVPRRYIGGSRSNQNQMGIPRVNIIKPNILGPPISISDYRTTITPQTINTFFSDEGPPKNTYLGHFNSNEIGRRMDDQLEVSTKIQPNVFQRNSHQPDNPMVVENLSSYIRSVSAEEPSRKAVSS